MSAVLRHYRTLRELSVGRIASMRAAWRVTFGPELEYEEGPEPEE